jgi:hypothetical protein
VRLHVPEGDGAERAMATVLLIAPAGKCEHEAALPWRRRVWSSLRMPTPRARSSALVALGAWLATRSTGARAGLALTGAAGLGTAIAALASDAGRASTLPLGASTVVAWTGGLLLAVAAASRAMGMDRDQGPLALIRARGVSSGEYVRGRVLGLVGVLALGVGGATLTATLAAIVTTRGAGPVLRLGAGALAYALAFAATVGPVALATLAARTRVRSYLVFAAVMWLPMLCERWTSEVLPRHWRELTSIPAALAAVRTAVAFPAMAGAAGARAVAGLAAVVALSLLVLASRARTRGPDGAA